MKNLMLVTSAFVISALAIAHQMHATPPPPPYYAIMPSGCVPIAPPGCVTSGTILCTVVIDGQSAPVRATSNDGRPCALPMYKN